MHQCEIRICCKAISFSIRAFAALVVGLAFGLIINATVGHAHHLVEVEGLMGFIGNVYVNLLKMLIVPLVLTAILHAILNLRSGNGRYMTQVAVKVIGILLITTGISAIIGMFVGQLFSIGNGLLIPGISHASPLENHGILEIDAFM